MNRREVFGSLTIISSHILFPGIVAGFITGCKKTEETLFFFASDQLLMVKEMIDLIIPETTTSSASQVSAHLFLDEIFGKCLPVEQQDMIKNGLNAFRNEFETASDKFTLLEKVDEEAFSGNKDYAWFIPIKQYTLVGFFTSKEGTTQASNYTPVPGDYQGEIPLEDDTLNYGLTALRYYL